MFKLVGVDVYLQSDSIPDAPKEHGPFRLVFIANRGMKVWPGEMPRMHLLDLMRLRYEAEGEVSHSDVESLLAALTNGGFTWAKAQKLFEHDGERKYSQPY
ncbi:MAG: isocitrate dehydrogenase [Armatimonadota bacterium]